MLGGGGGGAGEGQAMLAFAAARPVGGGADTSVGWR